MIEQRRQCGRHHCADACDGQFGLVVVVLQVGVHRHAGEDGIVQRPRARCLPQQQVRPWAHTQGRQPRIHAVGIGLQCCALAACSNVQAGMHACTQPMHAIAFVQVQRRGAKQLGEFAGRRAAHQIHLEIALLRVHIAERTHGIDLAGRIDGDHAQSVALHADRCRQAVQCAIAVQLRQAATHQQIQGQEGRHDQHHDCQQQPAQPFAHCRFLELGQSVARRHDRGGSGGNATESDSD